MQTKEFLERLDHSRISAAIAAAEGSTSGEIRVYIERGNITGETLAFAERKFVEMGMQRTERRNAILILVAPQVQKFEVVGDEGVHAKFGPEFWQQLVEVMGQHFRRGEFTDALVDAVASAGELLAQHFPRAVDDRNELSDTVLES